MGVVQKACIIENISQKLSKKDCQYVIRELRQIQTYLKSGESSASYDDPLVTVSKLISSVDLIDLQRFVTQHRNSQDEYAEKEYSDVEEDGIVYQDLEVQHIGPMDVLERAVQEIARNDEEENAYSPPKKKTKLSWDADEEYFPPKKKRTKKSKRTASSKKSDRCFSQVTVCSKVNRGTKKGRKVATAPVGLIFSNPTPRKRQQIDKKRSSKKWPENSVFVCIYCNAILTKIKNYTSHLRIHKDDPASCIRCQKSFWNSEFLRLHTCKYRYSCMQCGILCRKPAHFESHQRKHEKQRERALKLEQEDPTKYPAPILNPRVSMAEMRRCSVQDPIEIRTKYAAEEAVIENPVFSGRRQVALPPATYTCPYCRLIHHNLSDFRYHLRRGNKDHAQDPCCCFKCKKEYPNAELYRYHLCSNGFSRTCEACNITFTKWSGLQKHLQSLRHRLNTGLCSPEEAQRSKARRPSRVNFEDDACHPPGSIVTLERIPPKITEFALLGEDIQLPVKVPDMRGRLKYPQIAHYTCPYCRGKIATLLKYTAHLSTHADEGECSCISCKLTFLNAAWLEVHTCYGIKAFYCKVCDRQCKRQSRFQKHIASAKHRAAVKLYESQDYNVTPRETGDVRKSGRTHSRKRVHSADDSLVTNPEETDIAEDSMAKNPAETEDLSWYTCSYCAAVLQGLHKFKKHLWRKDSAHHADSCCCYRCQKEYPNVELFRHHRCPKSETLTCKVCQYTAKKPSAMRTHLTTVRHQTAVELYKSRGGEITHTESMVVKMSVRTSSGKRMRVADDSMVENPAENEDLPWYTCPYCSDKVQCLRKYKKHLYRDIAAHRSDPCCCLRCQKEFYNVELYNHHRCPNKENLTCDICQLTSSKPSRHLNHLNSKRHKQKAGLWTQAEAEGHKASRQRLNESISSVVAPPWIEEFAPHGEVIQLPEMSADKRGRLKYPQIADYSCPYCRGRVGSLKKYKAHLKTHADEGECSCMTCELIFTNSALLTVHTCYGFKQYYCNICDKQELKRSRYQEHLQTIWHQTAVAAQKARSNAARGSEPDDGTEGAAMDDLDETADVTRYTCPYCAIIVQGVKRYKPHLLRQNETHRSDPCCCLHCKKEFFNVELLKFHNCSKSMDLTCDICQYAARDRIRHQIHLNSMKHRKLAGLWTPEEEKKHKALRFNTNPDRSSTDSSVNCRQLAPPEIKKFAPPSQIIELPEPSFGKRGHRLRYPRIAEYTCPYCRGVINTIDKYKSHLAAAHSDEGECTCISCKLVFSSHAMLAVHVCFGVQIFFCEPCGIQLKEFHGYQRHLKTVKHKLAAGIIKDANLTEVNSNAPKPQHYASPERVIQLPEQILSDEGGLVYPPDAEYDCPYCRGTLNSLQQYREHLHGHDEGRCSCYSCGRQYLNHALFEIHGCHPQNKPESRIDRENQYTIKKGSAVGLYKPVAKFAPPDQEIRLPDKELNKRGVLAYPEKADYTCPYCRRIFHSVRKYRSTHLIQHKTEPCCCRSCKKELANVELLKVHVCSKLKELYCYVCQLQLNRLSRYKRHLASITHREKAKEFTDPMSDSRRAIERNKQLLKAKVFADPGSEIIHPEMKLDKRGVMNYPENATYTCVYCRGLFSTFKKYKLRHLPSHDGAPLSCIRCQKTLVNTELLRYHKITGCRLRYSCKPCGVLFKTQRTFEAHLISKSHVAQVDRVNKKIDTPSSYAKLRTLLADRSTLNGGKYSCPYCPATVGNYGAYMIHVRRADHSAPVSCKSCRETFHNSEILNDHNCTLYCTVCDERFTDKFKYRAHIKTIKHRATEIEKEAARGNTATLSDLEELAVDDTDPESSSSDENEQFSVHDDSDDSYQDESMMDTSSITQGNDSTEARLVVQLTNIMEDISKTTTSSPMRLSTRKRRRPAIYSPSIMDSSDVQEEPIPIPRSDSSNIDNLVWSSDVKEVILPHDLEIDVTQGDSLLTDATATSQDLPTEIKCAYCNKLQADTKAYKRHLGHHGDEVMVTCDKCGLLSLNGELNRLHLCPCRNDCTICGKRLAGPFKLQRHMQTHKEHLTVLEIKCGNCSQQFNSKKDCAVHIQIEHNQQPRCDVCAVHFDSNDANCESNRLYCERCRLEADPLIPKPISNGVNLNSLVAVTSIQVVPTAPPVGTINRAGQGIMPRIYSCEPCNYKTDKVNAFNRHNISLKHKKNIGSEQADEKFICDQCGQVFGRSETLATHHKLKHGEHSYSLLSQWKCKFCQTQLLSAAAYERHIAKHLNQRNFMCELCGKSFRTMSDLKSHKIYIHPNSDSEEDGPRCTRCDKIFSSEQALSKHNAKVHDSHKAD